MPAPVRAKEPKIETLSLEERIRQRAELLYQMRGDRPGSAVDDWLRAEEEIRREVEEQAVDEDPGRLVSGE